MTDTDAMAAMLAAQDDAPTLTTWFRSGSDWQREPEPPPPAVAWMLDEGGGLLRAGRRYLVVGEAGVGKSLLALGGCIEAAHGGACAVFLDWEDTFRTAQVRSQALRVGATEDALTDDATARLFYAPMVGEVLAHDMPMPDGTGIVVVDSVARCMGAMGLDENSAPDFHRFVSDVVEPLRDRAPDAAVVLLDHPGHADAKRGRGTSAKRPAVDVEMTLERAGTSGLRFVVRKDRHADLGVPVGGTAADVSLHPDGATVAVHFREAFDTVDPATGAKRRTGYMQRISRHLADQDEPLSVRTLRQAIPGRAAWVAQAADQLAREGYARVEDGNRGAKRYAFVRPYSEAADPLLHPDDRFPNPGNQSGTTRLRKPEP